MALTTLPFGPVVALVEDDASVLKGLTRLLRSSGCGVVPFVSAEQFLATRHEWVLDCLVLDVHFDGMSGLELAAHLAETDPLCPIILITALDDPHIRAQAEALGYACLRKPLDESELLDAIHKAMEQSQQRR
ncbi:MAG TPA: response regulator [Gemmatimonadales bacterium]|nr:response regulator [Gemmatimonadales bacterium]